MSNKDLLLLKQAAYDHCQRFVSQRISRLQAQIKDIEAGMATETKSSAGDKHETGRAMLQLEREKIGHQLLIAEQEQELLFQVDPERYRSLVALGALVMTETILYFIAISAGEFNHKGNKLYCISPGAPLAKAFLGKTRGDNIHFNGNTFTICEVL
jgi:hypothetical protein